MTNPLISNQEKEKRREQIVLAYIELALQSNFNLITLNKLATKLKCIRWYLYQYGGGMKRIEKDALTYAIDNRVHKVISQILVNNHPLAKKIKPELKKESVAFLLN